MAVSLTNGVPQANRVVETRASRTLQTKQIRDYHLIQRPTSWMIREQAIF